MIPPSLLLLISCTGLSCIFCITVDVLRSIEAVMLAFVPGAGKDENGYLITWQNINTPAITKQGAGHR